MFALPVWPFALSTGPTTHELSHLHLSSTRALKHSVSNGWSLNGQGVSLQDPIRLPHLRIRGNPSMASQSLASLNLVITANTMIFAGLIGPGPLHKRSGAPSSSHSNLPSSTRWSRLGSLGAFSLSCLLDEQSRTTWRCRLVGRKQSRIPVDSLAPPITQAIS